MDAWDIIQPDRILKMSTARKRELLVLEKSAISEKNGSLVPLPAIRAQPEQILTAQSMMEEAFPGCKKTIVIDDNSEELHQGLRDVMKFTVRRTSNFHFSGFR